MPTLTPTQVFLIGLCVAPLIFGLCILFTRANVRRAGSGLLGGFGFGLLNYGWDIVAARAGWWQYPAYNAAGKLPLIFYIYASIVIGGISLIGWRIVRRFGRSGLIAFLLVWSLWGYIHDTAGSALFASSNLMVIRPGFISHLADFLLYLTGMALSLIVTRWIGGPFGADALRQTVKAQN